MAWVSSLPGLFGTGHLDDFQNALDLLRNETPTYLLYSGSGAGYENGIKTTQEAVGEGEPAT